MDACRGMRGAVEKVRSAGASEVAVTERGTFFGYGDLVVDMRNFVRLRSGDRSTGHLRCDSLGTAAGAGGRRCQRRAARIHTALTGSRAAAGAVRQLEQLEDRCDRTDAVQVLGLRIVDVRLLLRDQQDLLVRPSSPVRARGSISRGRRTAG